MLKMYVFSLAVLPVGCEGESETVVLAAGYQDAVNIFLKEIGIAVVVYDNLTAAKEYKHDCEVYYLKSAVPVASGVCHTTRYLD